MKLLSKTNRYYFFYSAILLAFGGIIFYGVISSVIKNEVEEVLQRELKEYTEKATNDSTLLNYSKSIEFEVSPSNEIPFPDVLGDTLIREDNESTPYLQLKTKRNINGHHYQIILRESLIESEDVLFSVAVSMSILFVILLIGLFLLNNYLSKKLWKPFYLNLTKIKSYNLSHLDIIDEVDTDIKEFEELNIALIKMTDRIKGDYKSLKEFTENASHEIQTPLAIIRSNTDLLLQQINDPRQLAELEKIEMAAARISKTNQALLLLAKIENRHFSSTGKVDLADIIENCVVDFGDFIKSKKLKVDFKNCHKGKLRMLNKDLMQILLNNLLSNAISHNINNGYINIKLSEIELTIENSGKSLEVEPSRLFDRFMKADPSSQSTGLGLSIIKKICDILNYQIDYRIEGGIHTITIKNLSKG